MTVDFVDDDVVDDDVVDDGDAAAVVVVTELVTETVQSTPQTSV